MWEDMKLYWAWRGNETPTTPPTKKLLDYVIKGDVVKYKECVGVWDCSWGFPHVNKYTKLS